jgi:hypothetical protein
LRILGGILYYFGQMLLPVIKTHTRKTTATVEVENNIIKNMDIKKEIYL